MATAAAKRGRKTGTKPAAIPKKQARKRAKRGQGKQPEAQANLLQLALAENPHLTSGEFAIKFNLPLDEVMRHRTFVLQYLLDFNIKNAALRMGYPELTAWDAGRLMLGYAYSQLLICEIQRAATTESVATQGQLMSKIWEECNRPDTVVNGCAMSSSSTRLSALTLYARILGMLQARPRDVELTIRKIMHVGERELAAIDNNPDAWGEFAKKSQQRLKASTVVDV